MYTYDDYKNYYLSNRAFPDGQYSNKDKVLNEAQIKIKYQKYIRKLERKENKEPSDHMKEIWEVEKVVREKDPEAKLFWSVWNDEERNFLYKKCSIFRDEEGKILLDPAHILNRSTNPHLSNEELNIIMIPRYFHSLLDQHLSPFTGKHIDNEEHTKLWIRIVGEDRYNQLLEMKNDNN